ncbi:CopD family protein [Geodermatophilus sp. SYSU D01106]
MTALLPRPAAAPAERTRRPVAGLTATAVLGLGAVLVLALVVGGAATTGSGSGAVVEWGLPVATLAVRVAALGTVGALLFAAVLVPGRVLPRASRRAVRAASWWAAAWTVAVVVEAALTLARLVGVPPWALGAESVRAFLTQVPAGDAALGAAAAALVVAVGARRCAGSPAARVLLAVAGVGVVVPAVLTGHSAAAGDHLASTAVLTVHVVAAAVWVGGLLAVLLHGRDPAVLTRAAPRFSALALGCAAVVGTTGLLAGWSALDRGTGLLAGLGSGYGLLLAGKAGALAVLVALGRHHRRRTLPRLAEGRPGAFRRFAAAEVAGMLATVALAVALAASPPPAAADGPAPAPAAAGAGAAAPGGPAPSSVHDHGDLSVPVLVDPTGFTVTGPVRAGSVVTVHNPTGAAVTVTADDGSFDAEIPAGSLTSFPAPERPGTYPFTSRSDPSFTGVLVVG